MKTAILLVAYGTSNPKGKEGLRNFDHLCGTRFPGIPRRWAYTSLRLRVRLARERQKSDSVRQALMRLYYENFNAITIQPLQTINGREYGDVAAIANQFSLRTGTVCSVGKPLLSTGQDMKRVAKAFLEILPPDRKRNENVIFMGHGAKHAAVSLYSQLGNEIQKFDSAIYVGTMSGCPGLEDILPRLSSGRVWLLPMLSIIGQHALRDMAGEDDASWKSRIEARGHECLPVLKGMAQFAGISNIWLDHLENAARCIFPDMPVSPVCQ